MSDVRFDNLGPADYDRAKSVLNKAKHPGFVGRELFLRCATSGVVCVAVIDGMDAGVAMVAKEKLQALSVITTAQKRGVGQALMTRLMPRWVSAIEERVSFFEKLGYKRFGAPKVGQNGKHATQLLERGEMPSSPTEIIEKKELPVEESQPIIVYAELLPDNCDPLDAAEIDALDALIRQAVAADQSSTVLNLMNEARRRVLSARRSTQKENGDDVRARYSPRQ